METKIKDILMGVHPQTMDVDSSGMRNYPMGVWEEFSEGVRFKKIWDDPRKVIFICEMDKGFGYGQHMHSDCEEYLTILGGIMLDEQTNKTYVRSETVGYTRGTPHAPIGKTNCLMIISFYF